MSKLVGGLVGVLGIAAVGVTGAAYWSGLQAERWYQEALAEVARSGSGIKLSTVRYDRGLFSSHILTKVQMAEPDGSGDSHPSFAIRQEVYHGPVPLAGLNQPDVPMGLVGAVVRTTLDRDSSPWIRQLAAWYGTQEPLIAVSQIALDGSGTTHVAMPPLVLKEVEDLQSLDYSGLQGDFQVGPKSATVKGQLTIPRLQVVSKAKAASAGQSAAEAGTVQLRDLKLTVDQRRGSFDLLFGESAFTLAELRVHDQSSGAPLLITGLNVAGSLTAQGTQQVAGEMRMKADQVTVGQQSGTGSLHLAVRNLDGPTIGKLQQWQQQANQAPDDAQNLNTLWAVMKTLLAGQPELVLDTQAKMSQGDWQGKMTLNFQDFDESNWLQDPSSLLGALEKGSADLSASKALVETLLIEQQMDQLKSEAGDEQQPPQAAQALRATATAQVRQQLEGLVATGFVKLDGDRYTTSARFANGQLQVNGQSIPLMSAASDAPADSGETVPEEDSVSIPEGEAGKPAQQ